MATNHIKPFATSPDANVMTDNELAQAEELSTGFKLRSKADSKLIGKLIQDTSAAAYAIGEFVATTTKKDVTGSDPESLKTNFDAAVRAVVQEAAGGDQYVTDEELSSQLETINQSIAEKADSATVTASLGAKADKTELSKYAPLASPALTGTATLNGQNIATTDQLEALEIDLSDYTGNVSFTDGAGSFKMSASGITVKDPAIASGAETPLSSFALKSEIPTDVLTKTEAKSTYLTQSSATTTYATKTELSAKADSANVYDKQHLDSNFALKSEIPNDYLSTSGGTIGGDLTVTGTINATIEGTTENATKLATARAFTITGAVTGAGTTSFDGSADLTINTTAVNGTMVTGVVPQATKATQDGDGNVISTTYAKISQLTSVMTYKGTVASESALPKSDQTIGDVYNVTDTNMNYAWDGSKWDQLGSTVDLSGYLKTETANSTFATKNELTTGYLALAGGTLTGNVTVPAPTAEGHASTKKYVDDKITGLNISQYATTASLTKYAPLANPKFTGTATIGGQTIATVNQIPDISDLATKSEVAGKANATHTHTVSQVTDLSTTLAKYLPLSGGTLTGKVTGTITQADAATKATNDGSGKNIATTYATKTELSDGLGGKANTSHTHTTAQVTGLDTALAGKAATNHTHTIGNVTGLQDALDGKQAAGDYALNSALSTYAPLASPVFTGTPKIGSNKVATTNQIPSITHLAPLASPALTGTPTVNGVGIADDNDVAAKINLTGSRGQLAGYETVASGTSTINANSPDSIETNQKVTVSNGTAGTCWTKVAHLTNASPNVTLGSQWHWQNGSGSELKQNGFLVLCWCGSAGLAIYNNIS